ncbi:MAG: hypothetical protein LBL96_11835 [Clostridiales bacterium]|nr:hypothetical protein [Clostridiales bacterium]
MIQTYRGYFERDRFRLPEETAPVAIPEYVEVYITVTGRALPESTETIIQTESAEIAGRREMAQSLRGIIPSDVDLDAMRAERIAKRALL